MEAEAGPAGGTLDILPGGEGTSTAGRGAAAWCSRKLQLGWLNLGREAPGMSRREWPGVGGWGLGVSLF